MIVNVQDFWEFPVDASRIVGELPPILGLKLIPEFTGFLERKFGNIYLLLYIFMLK